MKAKSHPGRSSPWVILTRISAIRTIAITIWRISASIRAIPVTIRTVPTTILAISVTMCIPAMLRVSRMATMLATTPRMPLLSISLVRVVPSWSIAVIWRTLPRPGAWRWETWLPVCSHVSRWRIRVTAVVSRIPARSICSASLHVMATVKYHEESDVYCLWR